MPFDAGGEPYEGGWQQAVIDATVVAWLLGDHPRVEAHGRWVFDPGAGAFCAVVEVKRARGGWLTARIYDDVDTPLALSASVRHALDLLLGLRLNGLEMPAWDAGDLRR